MKNKIKYYFLRLLYRAMYAIAEEDEYLHWGFYRQHRNPKVVPDDELYDEIEKLNKRVQETA